MAQKERSWYEFGRDFVRDPLGETAAAADKYVVKPVARAVKPYVEPVANVVDTYVVKPVVRAAKPYVEPVVKAVKPYVEPVATAVSELTEDPVGVTTRAASEAIRDAKQTLQNLGEMADQKIDQGFDLAGSVIGVDGATLRATFNRSAGATLTSTLANLVPGGRLGLTLATNEYARGGANETLRDFFRDVAGGATYLVMDSFRNKSDQGYSDWAMQGVEDLWDTYIKPVTGSGEFEFRMATGFEAKMGMMYNGKPLTQERAEQLIKEGYLVERVNPDGSKGYEVSALLSIYLKNNNGSTEILDNRDPRFNDIAGPYMTGQVGTMFVGGWLSKSGSAAGWINRGITASDIGNAALAGREFAEPLIFKPEAVRDLARAFQDPSSLNPDRLRELTNTLLYDYSHKEGPWSSAVYVPSLRGKESPYERLAELSTGGLTAHRRETPFTPFDTERTTKFDDLSITKKLQEDKVFQRSFYDLSARALSGERLTDSEIFSLRFMANVVTPGAEFDLGHGKYDAAARQETLEVLREELGMESGIMATSADDNKDLASFARERSAEKGQEIKAEEQARAASERKAIQDGLRGVPGSGGMIIAP